MKARETGGPFVFPSVTREPGMRVKWHVSANRDREHTYAKRTGSTPSARARSAFSKSTAAAYGPVAYAAKRRASQGERMLARSARAAEPEQEQEQTFWRSLSGAEMRLLVITMAGTLAANIVTVLVVATAVIGARFELIPRRGTTAAVSPSMITWKWLFSQMIVAVLPAWIIPARPVGVVVLAPVPRLT